MKPNKTNFSSIAGLHRSTKIHGSEQESQLPVIKPTARNNPSFPAPQHCLVCPCPVHTHIIPLKLDSLCRVMHSAVEPVTVKAAGLNHLLLFLNKNLKFLSSTYPAFFNLPGAGELLDADGCQTHTGYKTSKVEKEREITKNERTEHSTMKPSLHNC